MKRKYIIGAVLAALLAVAVLYLFSGRTPAVQPSLRNLSAQSAVEIKNEFNAAKDEVRVLLLLSPT